MARLFARATFAVAVMFSLFIPTAASAQDRLPADAFLWQMANVELSPDGQYLSMVQPYEGRTALVIYPMGGGEPVLIEPGQRGRDEHLEVSWHMWKGNDRILVSVNWNDHYVSRYANFRVEQSRLLSVRPDGSDPQVLFESRQGRESDLAFEDGIIDGLANDDEHVLVQLRDCGGAVCVSTVHKVNIVTGRSVVIARGGEDTVAFATDHEGNVVARLDETDGNWRLYARNAGELGWRQIMTRPRFDDSGEITLAPIAEVDGLLYVRSDHEGRDGIYTIDPEFGGGLERFYLHPEVDAGGVAIDTDDDSIDYVSYIVHEPGRAFFDEELEADYERYNRLIPGDHISLVGENDDENLRVLAAYGVMDPTVYYLMDDEAGTISEIGQAYPQLSPENLGEVHLVTYTARDGLEISGYLALPPGASMEDGPFPFVMFPHGGPNARDTILFDGLRQFLATRGYAVFAPQFRGSRGFGNEFMRLGFEEWGGAMQNDLTDGTMYLIDQGIADPDRMCIFGWSYSAYTAVMAAIDTPDLYNCAAAINGVYDLPRLQGDLITSRAYRSLEFWRNTMGENNDELARVSPARRADEIHIPVLILASEEDQTAPYEESVRMIQALSQANVPHESHIYEYGNHSLDYRPNRIDAYNRVEAFLAAHINN